jgi:hypothetical protein
VDSKVAEKVSWKRLAASQIGVHRNARGEDQVEWRCVLGRAGDKDIFNGLAYSVRRTGWQRGLSQAGSLLFSA